MRDILFRGKLVDNGEWVEGSLIVNHYDLVGKHEDEYRIVDTYYGLDDEDLPTYQSGLDEEVVPSTVGQYTGLTDKNGVRIFENDILKYSDKESHTVVYGVVRFGLSTKDYQVEDSQRLFGFYIEWLGKSKKFTLPWRRIWRPDIAYWIRKEKATVYGNIFDNDIKELGE